jgi:hypothetical protein
MAWWVIVIIAVLGYLVIGTCFAYREKNHERPELLFYIWPAYLPLVILEVVCTTLDYFQGTGRFNNRS